MRGGRLPVVGLCDARRTCRRANEGHAPIPQSAAAHSRHVFQVRLRQPPEPPDEPELPPMPPRFGPQTAAPASAPAADAARCRLRNRCDMRDRLFVAAGCFTSTASIPVAFAECSTTTSVLSRPLQGGNPSPSGQTETRAPSTAIRRWPHTIGQYSWSERMCRSGLSRSSKTV